MMFKVLSIALFLFQADSTENFSKSTVGESNQDSIKTEMILRPEDLIWKSNWNFYSIDRMSYKVNSGQYGYYGPQPTYLLDGIPFDPTFFGMNFSQLFPASLNQIHKVNPQSGIGIHNDIGYASGLLDIQSVPLKDGLSVFASGQFGHNSDEPGPWIFDEEQVSPNVERFGPWADAGVSLKISNWYAKALVRSHSYLNINPHVQTRTKNLVALPEQGRYPDALSATLLGIAETGIRSKYVDFRIQGIRSESEEFLYFQPLAREVPTDFFTEQYSAAGSFLFTDNFGIRAMAQYREKRTGYRENQFDQRFDWSQTQKIGRTSLFLEARKFQFDIGSELRQTDTEASGLREGDQQYIDLFIDQQVDITSFFRFGSYSAITLHDDEKPIRGKAFFEVDFFPSWTSGFEGSYSELLPDISNPIDEWISHGYDVLNRLDSYAFVPNDISNTRLYTLSNRNNIRISDLIDAELGVQYVNHQRFHVPFQNARYYIQLSTIPDGYFFIENTSGQRLQLSFDADVNLSESLKQSFGIYWARTLNGDPAYKTYWKTIPEYLFRHSTIYTPFPDLEVRLNVQYQTKAEWYEFRRLDGRLNRTFHPQFPYQLYTYSSEIPAGVNIDMVLSKWFWEQRMRAVFMLSNLFNQKYKTHPIGSQEGFGYMLRLELRF